MLKRIALLLMLASIPAAADPYPDQMPVDGSLLATIRAEPARAVGVDPVTGLDTFFPEDLASPDVYRGTRSVAGEFGAQGWVGNCTATAVALNVVVTAGHCKSTGSRIQFRHRQSGNSYAATCTRHPRYNTRTVYNDWALCKLDEPLPGGSLLGSFAKVKPEPGTKLLINGFGAPTVGVHHWGTTTVRRYDGQDLVTCGPSTLGGGDSGGALILWNDDRTLAGGFTIVAVNSRGNGQCDWYNEYTHSEFQTWAREYERDKGVRLCGISADCFQPDEPLDCGELYEELGACWAQPIDDGRVWIRSSDDPMPLPMPADSCRKKYEDFGRCIVPPPSAELFKSGLFVPVGG